MRVLKSKPEGLAAYIAVKAAYWAFMLTDGPLRMLVLLHLNTLGHSARAVARFSLKLGPVEKVRSR